MKTEYLPVTIHRWAKRTKHVLLEFAEDGNVAVVHVGKPKKRKPPIYTKLILRVEIQPREAMEVTAE